MVSNPHFYGQSTTGTPNQIEDGVDFPHTGIIKALADGLGQNYAISGFDITFDSATQIDVALGVIFRDGKRHAISAVANLALGRTTASENSYHLVVVDKDNAIAIRSPSAKDKVANYTVRTLTSGTTTAHKQGDTVIAVVTHNGSNPAPVQYLTVDKAENSLSIGYSNSGTYAEGLTIDTDAGDTTIENKVSDKDIIFKVNDGGTPTEVMRIDGSVSRVGIGTTTPEKDLHVVGSSLFGNVTGSEGTAPRTLNLIGNDAVIRVARTSTNSPALEFLHLSADGNTRHSYWDIYTDGDRFTIRDRQSGDINVLTILESNQNVGIGTIAPANVFQVSHTGDDASDGIMVVREDTGTLSGDLLGGIGFDSTDGNVPSRTTEASAFISAYATEDHGTGDKGGELKMGISFIDENDDTTSTVLSRIGYPTATNATVYAGAFSRAAVATVAAATYSPAIADSGTVIIMTNASSIVTLPDVGATEIGVQFTIINNSGGTLTGKILSADFTNTRFNGAGSYAAQDIEDDKAKTFLCVGADNWQVIG